MVGLYSSVSNSANEPEMYFSDLSLVDNKVGLVAVLKFGKLIQLANVSFVGHTGNRNCTMEMDASQAPSNMPAGIAAGWDRPTVGLFVPSFTRPLADTLAWPTGAEGVVSTTTMHTKGVTKFNSVFFANYLETDSCGINVCSPMEFAGVARTSVADDAFMFVAPPPEEVRTPDLCGDLDCDGPKHCLLRDLDGTLTGVAGGSIISNHQSFLAPQAADVAFVASGNLTAELTMPFMRSRSAPTVQGILRTGCTEVAAANTVWCKSAALNHVALSIESSDSGAITRRLGPVGVYAAHGSDLALDIVQGPAYTGACPGVPNCRMKPSLFNLVVPASKYVNISFSEAVPQVLTITPLSASTSTVLAINYTRGDVFEIKVFPVVQLLGVAGGGVFVKPPEPYIPVPASASSATGGMHYWDSGTRTMYVVVKDGIGQLTITIKPSIAVAFVCQAIKDERDLNLATDAFIKFLSETLKLPLSSIRIAKIVQDAGRRRQLLAGTGTTIFEFLIVANTSTSTSTTSNCTAEDVANGVNCTTAEQADVNRVNELATQLQSVLKQEPAIGNLTFNATVSKAPDPPGLVTKEDIEPCDRANAQPVAVSKPVGRCDRANAQPVAVSKPVGRCNRANAQPVAVSKPVGRCDCADAQPVAVSKPVGRCDRANAQPVAVSKPVGRCNRANAQPVAVSKPVGRCDCANAQPVAVSKPVGRCNRANAQPVAVSKPVSGCNRANAQPVAVSKPVGRCNRANAQPVAVSKPVGRCDRANAQPVAVSKPVGRCNSANAQPVSVA
eukprot:tig00021572_g22394.t1